MTINDKLLISVLKSLLESKYSKNTEIPVGKPSTSGRPKPKSVVTTLKSQDEEEVGEEDLEEQTRRERRRAGKQARRDYKRDRDAMKTHGAGWVSASERAKKDSELSATLKGAMGKLKSIQRKNQREDSSTNWQDRIVDILLEKRGDASARALAGARKAHADLAAKTGRPTTHNAFEDRPVPPRGSPQAQELADKVKIAKTVIKHGPYSDEISDTNKKINAHRKKHPINYPKPDPNRSTSSVYRGPRRRKTTQSGMYFKSRDGKDIEI